MEIKLEKLEYQQTAIKSIVNTIEYVGEWEALYNSDFNYTEFGTININL
ncbi:MAG: hypothetical protein K8R54_06695 [Bacteroidales bacterium]|nr:hypothetical protein [Bacteroidales bacterium]